MSLTPLWEKAKNEIRAKIGVTSYETWFSSLHVKEKSPDTLVIETPDNFFKNWIVEHYEDCIQETLDTISTRNVHIEYEVTGSREKIDETASIVPEIKKEEPAKVVLNNRFTFDNFVIGPSNRFACAASLAVAESPARAYNPLFIYGHVGLGKTHLVHSITHKVRQLHPHLKCCYMSSEKFTNELIDAIRHRSTANFRKKYREMDVLLIDDIQFIAGKESTQEEFFHTFNNLHESKKQIIITSDRPPKEISNLEERLISRFAWGLITDIQPPDYETRIAILKKKAEIEPTTIPDDVIHFIAQEIKTNIRELEGALIRVVAYSHLEGHPINIESARIILKDMVRQTTKIISVEMIQKAVSEHFNIPVSELKAKKRNQHIVMPRQVAMYLCRQLGNMSLPEIGNAFGGKDHTTVLHSFRKIEGQLVSDITLKQVIHSLTDVLKR
jgi:chromosomal replication initiator protein